MKENNEGFLYPYVDEALCDDWGICKHICPVNLGHINDYAKIPKVLACCGNDVIRLKSSSGGLSHVLQNMYSID